MCGRVVQARPLDELAELYEAPPDAAAAGALPPRYNVAPTDPLAVVVLEDGRRRLTAHRWGLLPPSRPISGAAPLINARAETIQRNGLFRSAFERRRCLVPVDGFYEWQRLPDRRQPWFIHRRDEAPLTLAGIWAPWRDGPDGRLLGTSAIVTTAPDRVVERLHDRMPVVLPPAAWARWLDPRSSAAELVDLLAPVSDAGLTSHPVAAFVNSVRNDGAHLVEPVTEQAALFDS